MHFAVSIIRLLRQAFIIKDRVCEWSRGVCSLDNRISTNYNLYILASYKMHS